MYRIAGMVTNMMNAQETGEQYSQMEKRYEEAKIYIEQAMKNEKKEEESAVIAEHAADIYSMTGDTTKAIELWKKALNMEDCSNKALIEKKLKLKKYIAK